MNRKPTEPAGKSAVRVRLDGRDKLPSQNRLAVKLKATSKAAENRPAREATQGDLDRHMRTQGREQSGLEGFKDTTRMKYMQDGGSVKAYATGGEAKAHKAPVKKAAGGAMPAPKKRGVPVASREPMIKRAMGGMTTKC